MRIRYQWLALAGFMLTIGGVGGGLFQKEAWAGALPTPTPAPQGLSVNAQGVVVKDGKIYRAIGVNYFDAFMRTFSSPNDTSYRAGFQVLANHKIPYARVSMAGFAPNDYKVYLNTPTEYFRRMDGVVKAAEDYHVGIIADLFWNNSVCADVVGQHMNAYDDPTSATYTFMRKYIDDVVGRYKNSPGIAGWECGNEYNLSNDLSNGYSYLSNYAGSPATRDSALDNFPCTRTNILLSEFAKEVRRMDPYRIIVSGNSEPRGCAWHLTKYQSWTQDTVSQFGQVLRRDNPDPLNVVCVHAYYTTSNDFFSGLPVNYSGLMAATKAAAKVAGKPVFVGEFSAPSFIDPNNTPNPNEHAQFAEILASFEDNKIPLAAVWTFGRWDGWGFGDPTYDIEATNARGYMLDLIQQANERMAEAVRKETNAVKGPWELYE